MKKPLLFAVAALGLAVAQSFAAVMVTSGIDEDGLAFIEVPELAFEITTTVSTSLWGLVFENVHEAFPEPLGSPGSGLELRAPNATYVFSYWEGEYRTYGAALHGQFSASFVSGATYIVPAGRFTLWDRTPEGFPVFPSGEYELYLQGFEGAEPRLSANAQAVPEPSVMALLAIGGLAAFIFRRKTGRKFSL